MAPKRNAAARPATPARRGRSSARGRGRGGKSNTDHARVLSDITEESVAQITSEQHTPKQSAPQQTTVPCSKKRTFQNEEEVATTAKRETRAQAAKKAKHHHSVDEEVASNQKSHSNLDQTGIVQVSETSAGPAASHIPDVYVPSLNLLFFVHVAELDTDSDTESITLNLINLTLANSNWHGGLSGLVQPVACFLIASLLARRQNLVEDVAAGVEMFGLDYQQLVEGYRLLWDWPDNMSGVVGVHAEELAELLDPSLLFRQGEFDSNGAGTHSFDEETNAKPQPGRCTLAAQA
jgi:hypothetical protein